jgi:hypothetical protein
MIYTHSSNIIRVIKSRKIEREEHVVSVRKNRDAYGNLLGKLEGKQDSLATYKVTRGRVRVTIVLMEKQ